MLAMGHGRHKSLQGGQFVSLKLTSRTASSQGPSESGGSSNYSSTKETHFGFETVSEKEKSQKVRTVFENVADSYDLMNDWMSVGVHRVWKDIFVHRLDPGNSMKLIDVAGGTGDIAFRFLKYHKQRRDFSKPLVPFELFPLGKSMPTNPRPDNEVEAQYQVLEESSLKPAPEVDDATSSRSVLVCDINPKMLDVGRIRAKTNLSPNERTRIDWLEGDAENLHKIADNSFDAYTIAYGIRNCVHIDKVLTEAYRVLKPGGRFMCLEFSRVNNPLLKWAYDQYSFQVIPALGQVIAGDFDSYKYLVESIRKFPSQEEFKSMIEIAGFRFVTFENLTFGVSSIHSGFKL